MCSGHYKVTLLSKDGVSACSPTNVSPCFFPGKHRQLSFEEVYRCPHPSSTYNSCMI